ncbi:hypothetical protein [Pantoea vagans]|uniref:hypothetical protein n=1 Tax=Pantoea vagans TaxID=470934 RepID=UPI003FA38320
MVERIDTMIYQDAISVKLNDFLLETPPALSHQFCGFLHAAANCILIHDPDRIADRYSAHSWRSLTRRMHLDEKRCIKQAEVAGIALRATTLY